LELAAELGRLAPFGLGNPGVTLLLAGSELSEVATTADGKHLRFRVRHRQRPAGSAIAFNLGRHADRARREVRYDVIFRLEENRWNGTVAPQLVVSSLVETPERYESLRAWFVDEFRKDEAERAPEAQTIFAELGIVAGSPPRDLLESEGFRALLDEPEALPEAA
jgi:RecJ OB domain